MILFIYKICKIWIPENTEMNDIDYDDLENVGYKSHSAERLEDK